MVKSTDFILDTSEGEDDHFSDASEGRRIRDSLQSGQTSPIPRTRIERIDDKPSHGEVPGTDAYNMRRQDAVPDEVEIVPEGSRSRRASSAISRPLTPGGTPIPRTVVEKVDPASPSHGDIPGTEAFAKRRADATPDLVRKISNDANKSPEYFQSKQTPGNMPIPETKITKVDAEPAYGEEEGTIAQEMRQADATPDTLEIAGDAPGKPRSQALNSGGPLTGSGSPTSNLNRSEHRSHGRRKSTLTGDAEPADEDDIGDDFDEF